MPYGVKANIRAPHKFMRMGALVWVKITNPGGGNDRFEVIGLSRGGRKVSTWIDARDLENFRAGWFPDEHSWFGNGDKFPFQTKEAAQAWADAIDNAYASGPVRPHAASFGTTGATPPSSS